MTAPNFIDLGRLQAAVQESAEETRAAMLENYCGCYAGIIPVPDLSMRYSSTPKNTQVFACTGGDGVHYSILELSSTIQPIVMTVPMNFGGPYNWILGENLNEFLSLGYYNGWFPLEQLCYENEWVFKFYQGDNHEELESPEDELFTEKLRSKLGYGFIPLNEARLGELRKKYFHLLEFEDDRYGR